jgi:peptidoglycan hydrolase CwlO-like protein
MSEREIAQRIYSELQKKYNPSAFDTMGAFNQLYNGSKVNSLAVPMDVAKAIDPTGRQEFIDAYRRQQAYRVQQEKPPGFWGKLVIKLEKAYNLAAQGVSFGLLLGETETNPLFEGKTINPDNIRKSWEAARTVSPGRAVVRTIAGQPIDLIENALSAATLGKSRDKTEKFIKDHLLFAANDFDIYQKEQAEEAFREQTFGRWSSYTTDVIARFVIDPTIIGGKIVKGARAFGYATEGVGYVKSALAGEETTRKARKVKANFEKFVESTDGLGTADLFRIKAIRESANPATLADVLAQANKIEDVATRHKAKADIILWAQGDAQSAGNLIARHEDIAARIANLEDEITAAKYLGSSTDKTTGQLTMDLVNQGDNLEKNQLLLKTLQAEIDETYKAFDLAGTLSPNAVPRFGSATKARQFFTTRDNWFTDLRNGAAGPVVRFLQGFAYKRPRGWIDFTDNQSVQTLDNMLSRVRDFSTQQSRLYAEKVDNLKARLEVAKTPEEAKVIKQEINKLEADVKQAEFSIEKRNALFDKYTSAPDADARAAAYLEVEEEIFNTVARQFGFTNEQDVLAAWRKYSTARNSARNLIRERAYTGAGTKTPEGQFIPAGSKVSPIEGAEGVLNVVALPLNETQLLRQLPTLDIDQMYNSLMRYTRAQRGKPYEMGAIAQSKLMNIGDGLDSLLKFEVLARLGYPIRNVTEGYMRIMSTVGPMAIMNRVAYGLGAAGKNLINSKFKNASVEDVFKWSNGVKLEAKKQQLEALMDVVDDPDVVAKQIAEIDAMLGGKVPVIDKFGMGLNQIRIGNKVVTVEDALGATPQQAAFIRDKFIANASQIVDDHFTETSKAFRNSFETTGDWIIVNGNDEGWEQAYLRVVNRQIRGSKLTRILLQDKPRETLIAEARSFLLKNPEGRRILRNLALGREVDDIIQANLENIDNIFPAFASGLRRVSAERAINADDIKLFFTNATDRPSVNAAQVSNANGTSTMAKNWSKFQEGFYNIVGEAPERALVRNPLFVDLYRKRLEALVRNAIDTYPGDEIPALYLRKLESNSRQWARAEMRRTLYDTSERVEAASTMRYIFPFFGAFADVVEKWGKIVIDDPSVIRKLETIYDSPDRNGMVEEKDGIKYINIPGEWAKRLGLGDRPRAIPKPSLNLIFQGGAWWNPGAGWFVQAPLSLLVKRDPKLEKNFLTKEVLPYGPQGTGWKDILIQSAAARKALQLFEAEDPQRQNLTVLIAAEENAKYDAGLRDTIPTAKEINDKVRKILVLDVASRLTLPFATNTRSPYQVFIDEYHRLREEDPLTATDRFYQMYGDDYYYFTTSLSKNNTGIAATIEANERAKQYDDLIAKNPEFGWFVVGDANAGEFSPAVYKRQRELAVAPGSTTKFRESQDAYEAIKDTKVEKGWILYNKGIDRIEAVRISRGLKSLESAGAEDLKLAKQQFIADLEAENREWADARGKIDINKVNTFLRYAKEITNDSRLKDRPDIKTMSEYLAGRERVRQALATRDSQSLDNVNNADIKAVWDEFIGELIDRDVTFNRIYTRILERDDLRKGF